MMMPANYSAIAENEVIYGGAGVADYLPNAWTAANVKTLSTNVLTILSNTFAGAVVNVTLGTMFGGDWGKDGTKLFGDNGSITSLFKYGINNYKKTDAPEMNALNKFMTVLGSAAAVYTLGTTGVKNVLDHDDTIVVTDGVYLAG